MTTNTRKFVHIEDLIKCYRCGSFNESWDITWDGGHQYCNRCHFGHRECLVIDCLRTEHVTGADSRTGFCEQHLSEWEDGTLTTDRIGASHE